MRPAGAFALLAAGSVGLLGAAEARADASRVVLATDRSADAALKRAEVRLAAELRAAGFVVDEQLVDGPADAPVLGDPPQGTPPSGPFATVVLRRAGGATATDVWVADHVTHKIVARRISSRGAGDGADRGLALRVVELMRASLVESLVLPAPAPGSGDASEPAPPLASDVALWTRDAMRAPAPGPGGRLGLALGVAGAFAGPDAGVAVAPELRVAWRLGGAWGVDALAALPAVGARVSAREGSASLVQELLLVEATFEPVPARAPFGFYLALGGGGYHLDASGQAAPPYTSGQAGATAAMVGGGGGLRLRLGGPTSLVVDVRELVALPRPTLVFGQERVAVAMQPGTLAGLSLAVDL